VSNISLLQPADIARVLPAALADAGGSVTLQGLEESLGPGGKIKISGMSTDQQKDYLREAFQQAIEILVRSGSAEHRDDRVFLTDRGWAQARALGVVTPISGQPSPQHVAANAAPVGPIIDVSQAEPYVRFTHQGVVVMGYLRDGVERYQGQPFVPPASALVDLLYRAEVDGVRSSDGLYTTLREMGVFASAVDILQRKCNVRLPGFEKEVRGSRGVAVGHVGRGGMPTRRTAVTWERLVCEVIAELGGHADWPTIAEAIGKHPASEENPGWREESRQALRNHTSPKGRGYFEVAEIGTQSVYTLTENGSRMAARRSEDERAPTLSKLLAKAVSHDDDGKLTDFELYALLHLAAELGKPAEAQAIYNRLPENFPDEDRYYLARHLIDHAEELRAGGS
jgi:hypothetical protein